MNKEYLASLLNFAEMHLRLAKLHAQFAKTAKDELDAMFHDSHYDENMSRAKYYILKARKERINHER